MQTQMKVFPSQQMGTQHAPDLSPFNWQFLAQGDSWFSISTLKPWAASNLLEHLQFPQGAAAVNCADPGDTLAHMIDTRRDPLFFALLAGPREQQWTALLLSAGGNDLIDAVQVLSVDDNQMPVPPHERLLLTKDDWDGPLSVDRYISRDGWANFANHLTLQFKALDFIRSKSRTNRDTPIFVHTYDYATPRASPALPGLGPWLMPALVAYEIPVQDWDKVADAFIDRLAGIILNLGLPNLFVVDTRNLLVRAVDGSTGVSSDWENEIHPTGAGYAKLAVPYVGKICSVLGIG
ncbi:hypothetical protein [Paraburkholderia sp. C35]|uniref:hypothetical protein n=1 Tax=Paraburkholderia sp. C35 TaxID=2126993 RepID=UPI0019520AEF|nr:hypothetical protein [Paraburkholderia sp. C35]